LLKKKKWENEEQLTPDGIGRCDKLSALTHSGTLREEKKLKSLIDSTLEKNIDQGEE